ncbi:MAG: hypothetical protein ACOY82_19780 [Pseudomonadota bacterium]
MLPPHAVLSDYDLSTVEGIAGGISALLSALPGYEPPAMHGVGYLSPEQPLVVEVFNTEGHDFPAMLLASILGHRMGTQILSLTAGALEEAIACMSPAERCTAYRHPNIAAWRRLRERLLEQPQIRPVAIFVARDYLPGTIPDVDRFVACGTR